MLRHMLVALVAIGGLLVAGAATAGPGAGQYGGQLVGQVTAINRAQNLLVLDNSTELRATDPRVLADLREGMRVKVDFEARGSIKLINEIWSAEP